MAAGSMRHRITLQKPAEVRDSSGGVVHSWVDFASVWAQVEDLNGYEKLRNAQMQARNIKKLRIRYIAGIDESFRVRFGSRYWNISDLSNTDEMNYEWTMQVQEVSTGGQ